MSRNQGIRSKNLVHPSYRTGSGAKAKVVAGIAQLGQAQGNHVTEQDSTSYHGVSRDGGQGYNKVKFGNELALNVGKGGPGAGRTVMPCGGQGTYGAVSGKAETAPRSGDVMSNRR